MNEIKSQHWLQSLKKHRLVALLLIGTVLCFALSSHAQIPLYGNLQAREYGDAVYRQLGFWANIGLDYNHTGVFAGVDSGHNPKVMQAKGEASIIPTGDDTTVEVGLSEFNGPSQTYYGSYTKSDLSLSFSSRRSIVATAAALVNAYIPYVTFDAINYLAGGNSIGYIREIRCDAVVEYSYEANGYAVWWWAGYPNDWSILSFPNDHNDAPTPPSDPAYEFSPWAQRGAPGHSPTFNTFLTRPSVIGMPTYQVTGNSGPGFVDITIRASDESGIHQIGFKIPGDANWNYSPAQSQHPTSDSYSFGPIRITNSGTLYVFAQDNGGNYPQNANPYSITVPPPPPPDTTKPNVVISSPAPNQRITILPALILGTANDNIQVSDVEYQLENASGIGVFMPATGTTSWSASISGFTPGTNTIRVRARDTSGNLSPQATRTVTFVVVSPLTLATSGSGQITGLSNGQLLEVGKTYKLTATPSLRNFFVNWSGDIASSNAVLNFLMQSNLTLQAHFVTNPFVGLKGKFHGLFSETNEIRNHDRSGAFSLALAEAGTYSGSFQLGSKKLPAKGKFDWLGQSLLKLKPSLSETVTITLQLDVTNLNAWVTGTVSNGIWTSPLLGYRAPVYPAGAKSPHSGKYTLIIPGSDDASASPGGDGYGTLTMSPVGAIKLAGKLADGSVLSQSTPVSADGWWALYSALYTGKGSLHGWMMFTNKPESDINGELGWIKPALATSKHYPLGFTNRHDAAGSIYVTPLKPNRVVNITNASVKLRHGNLIQPITNNVLLGTDNRITNLSSNKLTMTFTLTSGLFKGTVTDPYTGKAIPFTGAVLQKLDSGYGYFLGTNQSGQTIFAPSP